MHLDPKKVVPKPENDSIWHFRFLDDRGNRYLYEQFGHDWIIEKGDFLPSHSVALFDGKELKYFSDAGRVDYLHVLVMLNPTKPTGIRTDSSIWSSPVRMAFRPFSLAGQVCDSKNVVLTNEIIDGNRVFALRDKELTVCIDAAKNYMPVRWTSPIGGLQAEVAYQHDDDAGWVPHTWTMKTQYESETATVTQFAVNKPIADSDFELQLPNGALVEDNSTGTGEVALSIIYADGKQRPLKPGEFNGRNFQDLLESEPNSQ